MLESSNGLLEDFLYQVGEKNKLQQKFLKKSMVNIKESELEKLRSLIQFYMTMGLDIEQITDKYLYQVQFMITDRKYFVENGRYRYSTFQEVEHLYHDTEYMSSYVVGLGLSQYLWDTHREIMRFFITHISRLGNKKTYLEIGPGHGEYFVTAMQNSNFEEYLALDISDTSVKITKDFCEYSKLNLNKNYTILHKDFFDYNSNQKADAVILGELLEHVEQPENFLERVYNVAADDAFIYITTAVNAPQPDHIYLFNCVEEVLELLSKANFEVVHKIIVTANDVPLEKAIRKKYSLVVGFVLKKLI